MLQVLTSQYEIEIKQQQEELKETNETNEENKTALETLKLIVSRKILVHVQNFDVGHVFHSFLEDIVGMILITDSKSCLSGLNWPRSGKNSEFLALFGLVEGTLGIGWK